MDKNKFKCLICSYEWKGVAKRRKANNLPRPCPNCKSPLWNVGYNKICVVCKKRVFTPAIHHINGDHKNNLESNRLIICNFCHTAIHSGIRTPKRKRRTGILVTHSSRMEKGDRYKRIESYHSKLGGEK